MVLIGNAMESVKKVIQKVVKPVLVPASVTEAGGVSLENAILTEDEAFYLTTEDGLFYIQQEDE